ncbi:MAG: multidrug efflux MFS transporter [Alphaproteobacteria bacterium]|nr:multidrug efflux MFS transporter [Alphaproteobacteria bacterium]
MSGTALALGGAAPASRSVPLRNWLAVLGAMLGAFMAILDIQITNSSLANIQGTLGASLEEGSWISTGYLIAEIIVIPLTGWLAMVFGLRRYLLVNSALFLGFSMLCGTATSLEQMVFYRIGQGFTGGVLIPLAFTILLVKLPLSKRAIGSAIFGFTATFAPAIGPTVGGWLTETYSWHWIFYINVIPGVLMIAMIWYGLDAAPAQLDRLRRGDWAGIFCMAVGLGCLAFVLEEGQRKDWFGSDTIWWCSWIAVVFLTAFVAIVLVRREPFINLRLLRQRSLGSACLMNLATGLGLYGTVYIMPVYLTQVQGYNALQIGWVMMWMGLPQLALFPFLPLILRYVDSRVVCAFGIALFAASCFMNAFTMSHDTAIEQLKWSQLVRALGQPLLMSPLSQMAAVGIPAAQAGSASALFNMFRNLGGSIGIAALATLVERREHFHFSIIAERLTHNSPRVAETLDRIALGLSARGGDPAMRALAELARMVRREALVMAYADAFFLIGAALTLSIAGAFFLSRARSGAAAGDAH